MSEGTEIAPDVPPDVTTPNAQIDATTPEENADQAFLTAAQACFPEGTVTFMLPPRSRATPQEEEEEPLSQLLQQQPQQQTWLAIGRELLAASAAARVAAVGDFAQDRRLARIPLVPVALVAGGATPLLQQHLRARFPRTFAAVSLPRDPATTPSSDPRVRAERLLAQVCRALHLRPPPPTGTPMGTGTGLRTLDALSAHVAQLDDPQPVVVCITDNSAPLGPADRALLAELLQLCLLPCARRAPAAPGGVRLARKPVPLVLVVPVPAPTAPAAALGPAAADLAHARCFALADARGALDRLLMHALNQWAARSPVAVAPRALLYALDEHALADAAVPAFCRALDAAVHEQQRNEWKHCALALDSERLTPNDRDAMAAFAPLFRCLLILLDSAPLPSTLGGSNMTSGFNNNDGDENGYYNDDDDEYSDFNNDNNNTMEDSRMATLLRAFLGYEMEVGAPTAADAVTLAESSPRERAMLGDPLAVAWVAVESLDVDRALLPALTRMRTCLHTLDASYTAVLDKWRTAITTTSARVRAARPRDSQTLAVLLSYARQHPEAGTTADTAQEELAAPFFALFRPLATLTQRGAEQPDILEPGGLVDTLRYATGGAVTQRLIAELLNPTYPCAPGTREHHLQQQTSLAFHALLAMVLHQQQGPQQHPQQQGLQQRRRGTVSLAEWFGAFAISPGADRAAFGAAVQLLSQHAVVLPKLHHPDVVLLNLPV